MEYHIALKEGSKITLTEDGKNLSHYTRRVLMKGKKANAQTAKPMKKIEPFGKRKLNIEKFPLDLSSRSLKDMLTSRVGGLSHFAISVFSVETLSPAKTFGRGRTNLTLIRPTILQLDATPPYAGFDRR